MQHRELYRSIVPEDSYIITYSDLLRCSSKKSAKNIANDIYYKIGGNYSSESMKEGTKAHKIKELEINDKWKNEVRLSYKVYDNYYLTGTIDRYCHNGIIQDFKTLKNNDIYKYINTNQIETYAFLAMNNDLNVTSGEYISIDKDGNEIDKVIIDISEAIIVMCYSTFILPRFNLIKNEIEKLRSQYVERNN